MEQLLENKIIDHRVNADTLDNRNGIDDNDNDDDNSSCSSRLRVFTRILSTTERVEPRSFVSTFHVPVDIKRRF